MEMQRRWGSDVWNALRLHRRVQSRRSAPRSCRRYGRIVPGVGWFDRDQLGIDQGPIVAMIENYRSELVWKTHAQQSLHRGGLEARGVHGRMARNARALTALALACLAAAGCAAQGGRAGRARCCASGASAARARSSRISSPSSSGENPGIRVVVQQIPWTAAHEKLLTGFVGRLAAGPRAARQHVDPGVRRDRRARAARRARRGLDGARARRLLRGHLEDERLRRSDVRRSLVRRHARALLPQGPAEGRGLRRDAAHVVGVARGDAQDQGRGLELAATRSCFRPTSGSRSPSSASRSGSTLLADGDTRGGFAQPDVRRARRDWYVSLYHEGLAPVVSYTQLGNPYQEFSRGYVAMWITGPWNLGEFRRRLPPRAAGLLDDRARARAGRAGVAGLLARGRLLARASSGRSKQKDAAWTLRRVPLAARDPDALLRALGRPARAAGEPGTTRRSPATTKARAFRDQLAHVTPLPRVPEWEQIAQKLPEDLEGGDPRPRDRPRGAGGARRRRGPHPREAALDPGARGGAPWPLTRSRHEVRAAWMFLAPGLTSRSRSSSSSRSARRCLLSLTDFDIYSLGDIAHTSLRRPAQLHEPAGRPAPLEGACATPPSSSSSAGR